MLRFFLDMVLLFHYFCFVVMSFLTVFPVTIVCHVFCPFCRCFDSLIVIVVSMHVVLCGGGN